MTRVTNAELRAELARCRAGGELTEDMARMAMAVGQRYLGARKWRKIRRVVKEDAFSGYLVKLVRLWPRINDRNPFAYLTAMVRSVTIDEVRKEEVRRRVRQRVTQVAKRMAEDAARRRSLCRRCVSWSYSPSASTTVNSTTLE